MTSVSGSPTFRLRCAGIYMGDAGFRPFWEVIPDVGVVTFMHPDGAQVPWFFQCGMWSPLGQSREEAKIIGSITYGAILESYRTLALGLAHGDGYFPQNRARLHPTVKNAPHSM